MVSIFADRSSIILRKMLMNPGCEWVIHDFVKARDEEYGLGQGRVQRVLNEIERLGYIEREKRGAMSKAVLTSPDRVIENWLKAYEFGHNEVHSFYSPDRNIQKRLREYLGEKDTRYGLTLHSGANLYTSFFKTDDVYFYWDARDMERDILDMRQKLGLKQLVQGGNVHIIKPYYRYSVFFNTQKTRNYVVVSNLQLYLDLYHYRPRGREHAEYLRKILEEKGKSIA